MNQSPPDHAPSPTSLVMLVICVTAQVCIVKAVFEPGKSQKADGLTKVLAYAPMKTFVSDVGLAPLTH